jgi:putative transposase
VTTIAGDAATVPDLVGRDFTAAAPGQKLVGDITYIRTWEGWLYLATVIDCHTKGCIGYAMADHMRTELVTAALDMAARNGRGFDVHHDQLGVHEVRRHRRGVRGKGLRRRSARPPPRCA